jgi:hypothetical protein
MTPPSTQPPSFSTAPALLRSFLFERVLSESAPESSRPATLRSEVFAPPLRADPRTLIVYLLGSAVPESTGVRSPAILKVEKTPYDPDGIASLTTLAAWDNLKTVSALVLVSQTI